MCVWGGRLAVAFHCCCCPICTASARDCSAYCPCMSTPVFQATSDTCVFDTCMCVCGDTAKRREEMEPVVCALTARKLTASAPTNDRRWMVSRVRRSWMSSPAASVLPTPA